MKRSIIFLLLRNNMQLILFGFASFDPVNNIFRENADNKGQGQSKGNGGLISNNWYNFELYPWVIAKIGQTCQSGDANSSEGGLSKGI